MSDPDHAAMSPVDRHFAELSSIVDVAGRDVLDAGCGQGAFVSRLQRAGARAHGLEVDERTLDAARKAGVESSRLTLGDGRTLPYPDGAFDCVCFIFSFHHVPAAVQPGMLREVARVLRPGGYLFVAEPEPFGAMTEVIKPIDDETEVRTRSQTLLEEPGDPLRPHRETTYAIEREVAGAADLIDMAVGVDHSRAARASDPEIVAEVMRRFDWHAMAAGTDRYVLDQPCRAFSYMRVDG